MNSRGSQYDPSNELPSHRRGTGHARPEEARSGENQDQRSVLIGRRIQRNAPRNISYDVLKTWVDMKDTGQLILTMSSDLQQLEVLLNQPKISEPMIDLLVDAINHALTAQHQKESIRQLLGSLCRTKFMGHLTDYLKDKEITKVTWADAPDFFTSYLHILVEILDKLPTYANICASKASELSKSASVFETMKEKTKFLNKLTEFSQKATQIFRAQKDKENRSRGGIIQCSSSEEPPDNFVDLTVVPTISDLQEDARPFIRSAETEGGYKDIQHYLDVQFRLMREDFIFPLREAIVQFKQAGCKKYFTSPNVRFYYDVRIIGTAISERIDHCLQFNVSALKCSKEHAQKRFVFGSLLCLSKDNFESVIFATVTEFDKDFLDKGIVIVNFKTGLDDVFSSTSSDVYVMVQTTAYFESYSHVLEGLQEMVTKLPLQDYIVRCKTELKPPQYLLPSGGVRRVPRYDLSCLTESKLTCRVPVLTTVKWPKADEMSLNESQRAAVQLALTKELAVIQGPPGTGKTYVGLKVMQVLLENKAILTGSDVASSDPILVVCYTNHALDQFLEGVLNFCPDGIVRVGGQSKSEQLKKFNLKELKQKQNVQNSCVKQSVKECNVEMDRISTEINQLSEIMESLQTDIINEKVLQGFVKKSHYESLVCEKEEINNQGQLNAWLRTDNNIIQSVMPQMIKQHLITLILKLETSSSVRNLTKEMNVVERASFYHFYMNKYRSTLRKEINVWSSRKQNNETGNKIRQLQSCLKDAESKILGDEQMNKVLPQASLEKMLKYLTTGSTPLAVSDDRVVESWLLGLNKDLQSQLDDVEFIMNHNKKVEENDVYFDDAYKKEQNNRMVDDDSANVERNAASVRNALNSMAFVIQRAQLLGIIDDISMDEDEDEEDVEEWTTQMNPSLMRKLLNKLILIEPATEEIENSITSIWDLDLNERFALYNLWIKRYKQFLAQKMHTLVKSYKSSQEKKQQANSEETLYLLRKARVIGMTTSGAAIHRAVLQTVGCRIIVVEEAAEVLESHIVTSLNQHCKHLILIGDHQQLRPKTTVYQLAIKFGLEISLFERLIKNKVKHVMLKEQHRMRPEISDILRHIYPDLQDHPSVANYEKIRGVSKNIFFIQHKHREAKLDDSMSKANTHEAKFLVALYRYLLKQGYEPSQITILATYAGQVTEIYKILDKEKDDINLTTVDNYQGEENDIILLSLVRSNVENQAGFLKVDNRVCVALSRAKKGLYVIGNFDLLASQSKLWGKIISTANAEQIIGTGLPVICEKHPDFKKMMISDEDFKKCPEGGCGRQCQYTLLCGHTCGLPCHGYDPEHLEYKCKKSCNKKCEAGHPCIKQCSEACGKCRVLVPKKIILCGHEDQVACSVPVEEAVCTQRCEHILNCQHQCSGRCGQCRKQKEHNACTAPALYQWECGHTGNVACHLLPPRYPCNQRCGAILQCGHICQGTCLDCLKGAVHVACEEYCEKKLPCGHRCKGYCGVPCSPCKKWCPFQCRHGSCSKEEPRARCGHACKPCMEECSYRCKHGQCSKMCSENCDINCKKLCYRVQNFHENNDTRDQCSGLCGELCVCRKLVEVSEISTPSEKAEGLKSSCASGVKHSPGGESSSTGAARQKGTANTDSKSYEEKKGPLIKIPSCGHIFLVRDLDNYVYGIGQYGSSSSYIPCPRCEKPILKCKHYETINKTRSRIREAEKLKLVMQHSFSKKQQNDLLKSRRKLEDSEMLTEFHSLEVEKVKTALEVHAASFQFKCAFLLSTIFSIRGSSHKPSSLEMLESRKQALLRIPWRLTSQQQEEFVTEMSRCLWLLYLSHLASELVNGSLNNCIDDEVRTTIQELTKLKPTHDVLEKAERVSTELSRRMQRMLKGANDKANLERLEQIVICANRVVRSSDDQMLCHHLLVEDAKEDTPDSEAQTTAAAVEPHKPKSEPWKKVTNKRKCAAAKKQLQQQQEQQQQQQRPPHQQQQQRPPPQQQQKTSNNEKRQPTRDNNSSTPGTGAQKGNNQQQHRGAKGKRK